MGRLTMRALLRTPLSNFVSPQNVLLSAEGGHAKLADVGLSAVLSSTKAFVLQGEPPS